MDDSDILGIATVGERGQVAIPTEVRRTCNIKPGEKLIFFSLNKCTGFGAIKASQLSTVLDHLARKTQSLSRILDEVDTTSSQPSI